MVAPGDQHCVFDTVLAAYQEMWPYANMGMPQVQGGGSTGGAGGQGGGGAEPPPLPQLLATTQRGA